MKKILGVSFAAMLAVSPMLANAAPVAGEPDHAATATSAAAAPKYALVEAGGNDGNLATAGYVKGAYNATIKAVNAETDRAVAVEGSLDSLSEGIAKTNLVAAINSVASSNATTAGAGLSKTDGSFAVNVDDSTVEINDSDKLQVKDGGITAAKIANNAVTTDKILDANVTAAKLASDSVTTAKIVNGNVTAEKLAADSVTTAKIANENVTFEKIAGAAIHTSSETPRTAENASDTELMTEKAVMTAVESVSTTMGADYAKKTGVTQTITNSRIDTTGTVPVLTAWGDDNSANTVAITASSSITGATYAEPTPAPAGA